jgi:hypothetical protein
VTTTEPIQRTVASWLSAWMSSTATGFVVVVSGSPMNGPIRGSSLPKRASPTPIAAESSTMVATSTATVPAPTPLLSSL